MRGRGPEVTYTIPADGEENISINTKEIEVGFSESVDKNSIIFTLTNTKTRDNVETAQLDFNEKNNIAKFALSADEELNPSTKYEALIKSTVRNKVGIPMKKDRKWSFITSAT
jgi:methionine-rich copper-binding protein CopC